MITKEEAAYVLQAALALIDAHVALHPNVINELKTKWGER